MRCDDCQPRIEEYFDRELDEQTAVQIKQHLADCVSCSRLLQGLSAEQDIYVYDTPELEIAPESWSKVRSRIILTKPASRVGVFERLRDALRIPFAPPRISVWTTAGLILAAVGLTILVMRYAWPKQDQPPISVTANSPKPAPATRQEQTRTTDDRAPNKTVGAVDNVKGTGPGDRSLSIALKSPRPRAGVPSTLQKKTPNQLVREAEQKYLSAIALLSRAAERRRSRLDAGTQAKLEQALDSIDRTIAGTRKVVRKHPDDPVAVQYMLTAYARKVDMLREMVDH